jgi:hypothetical protein
MKLSFNPFRKRRPAGPEGASPTPPPSPKRVELRRSRPPAATQRREATRLPTESPSPAVKPPPSTRAAGSGRSTQSTRGLGRRAAPPPEPVRPPTRPAKQRKSEAELRREIGPTMQYDDPT